MFNILAQCTLSSGESVTIPTEITGVVSVVYNLIKIGIPLLLIIFGMLDLGKAVMAQKDDEIKKGQKTFVTRLIAAAIVFFVLVIVQFLLQIVAGDDNTNIFSCISEILEGK